MPRITLRQAFPSAYRNTRRAVVPARRTKKQRRPVHNKPGYVRIGAGLSNLIPKGKVITMNYIATATITRNIGEMCAIYRIKLNNLLDPETDNLGKNKSYCGYSQAKALYDRYKVMSTNIKVTFANSLNNIANVAMCFQDEDSLTTTTAHRVTDIGSRNGSLFKTIGYDHKESMSRFVRIRKQFGVPFYAFDDNYVGVFATDSAPVKQCYAVICIGGSLDAVADAAQYQAVTIRLTSKVYVFDPKEYLDQA